MSEPDGQGKDTRQRVGESVKLAANVSRGSHLVGNCCGLKGREGEMVQIGTDLRHVAGFHIIRVFPGFGRDPRIASGHTHGELDP